MDQVTINAQQVKVAVCQMLVVDDKNRNIQHAREMIEAAADQGGQLIVLPEMWNCPYSSSKFRQYAEDIDAGADASPSLAMLSEVARDKKVTIVGGSIPEKCGDHLYNTCCVVERNGKLKAKHRKVHLFDVDMPGKITFKESDTLTAGESLTIVDTDAGRIGIGICHDIRFPEVAMLYAKRGAQIICYPGAFHVSTGHLWELEQRARALDNQLYVVTCSPARDVSSDYLIWGHSTIIGPFGEISASSGHEEAIVVADIEYPRIDEIRLSIPLEKQLRLDLGSKICQSPPRQADRQMNKLVLWAVRLVHTSNMLEESCRWLVVVCKACDLAIPYIYRYIQLSGSRSLIQMAYRYVTVWLLALMFLGGAPILCKCSLGVHLTCGMVQVIQDVETPCNACQDVDMYGLEYVPGGANESLVLYQSRGCPANAAVTVVDKITNYNWCGELNHQGTKMHSFRVQCPAKNSTSE